MPILLNMTRKEDAPPLDEDVSIQAIKLTDEDTLDSSQETVEVVQNKPHPHPHPYLVGTISSVAYLILTSLFLAVLSNVRQNIPLPGSVTAPESNSIFLIILGAVFICFGMFAWFLAMASVYTGGFKHAVSAGRKIVSIAWMTLLALSALGVAGWVITAVILA